MKLPISWLRDFVDLDDLSIEEISRKLTLAGLQVDEITYVGLSLPERAAGEPHEFKTGGIAWDKSKIVVAEIREVMPHPNADRLTLLDLFDGEGQHVVLTGAPNIFHLKGQGRLPKPLKVAYAREGATLYDGHAAGLQLMTLKRTRIRGVDSDSMVCSEKELGISEDHEGIILLDDDAPVGTPLADYMGDAVLDIDILPNMARNANIIGVARELAALTGRKRRDPRVRAKTAGGSIKGLVSIEIADPQLNPRFVVGLIRNVEIRPSPYEVQRRLKLAGVRPINGIVDATNYAMFELGQPLHAFDFDALQKRAGKSRVKILTRTAREGEKLTTLDGIERQLSPLNVLVCDEKGPLSIAGVMGGAETEVTAQTTNVLLEGAAWNFINIRRTAQQHNLPSEASFRFSRGVHPAIAQSGVQLGLGYMARWSDGTVAPDLVDLYPLKPKMAVVELSPRDVKRLLGLDMTAEQIVRLLEALEFKCRIQGVSAPKRPSKKPGKSRAGREPADVRIAVTAPPHRMDIGAGIIGVADVIEEIARIVGFDRIPSTNLADALPPQVGNPDYEWEEHLRDLLAELGFQEVVSYRLTTPEREARLGVREEHVRVANPIAPERSVLRRSLLASVLDDLERNSRLSASLAFFEIGPVFEPSGNELPAQPRRLALAMTGMRNAAAWDTQEAPAFDFFDLKGRIELLLDGIRISQVAFEPVSTTDYLHPGKAAEIRIQGKVIGVFGELHPSAKEQYEFGQLPVVVAEMDLQALRSIAPQYEIRPVPSFPPVLEDIAIIVDESVAAARVGSLIREAGGSELTDIHLFDIYRGEQVGAGKKSLAYSLTYQAQDKTMTDAEAASIRNRIVKRLQQDLNATLRG